jgi:hypothetical protein
MFLVLLKSGFLFIKVVAGFNSGLISGVDSIPGLMHILHYLHDNLKKPWAGLALTLKIK